MLAGGLAAFQVFVTALPPALPAWGVPVTALFFFGVVTAAAYRIER
jgi:hypothetical protein